MREKLIKCFTPDELKEYKHNEYLRHREYYLEYSKQYRKAKVKKTKLPDEDKIKKCKDYQKKYFKDNQERLKEYQKKYYKNKYKEKRKNKYEKQKQVLLEYQKNYYQKNKDKIKKQANKRYRIKCGLEEIK